MNAKVITNFYQDIRQGLRTMKYTIGQQVWFKSLGSEREYWGTIIDKNEEKSCYGINSGKYKKIVFEDEIIKLKE